MADLQKEIVGILGGSFNPVHIGHMMLAQYLTQWKYVDRVWLTLSPLNPLKEAAGLIPDMKRLAMITLATKGAVDIETCDIELSMPRPSYTIDTLDLLRNRHKNKRFEMSEGAVSFSHAVHVFLALEGTTLLVEGVDDFSGQLVGHRLAAAFAGIDDEIFHGNRFFAVSADFSRNLESSSSDATALDLYLRSDILKSFFPNLESGLLLVGKFCLYILESGVKDGVCGILLAVIHQMVHKLSDPYFVEDGIRKDYPFLRLSFSHCRELVV